MLDYELLEKKPYRGKNELFVTWDHLHELYPLLWLLVAFDRLNPG